MPANSQSMASGDLLITLSRVGSFRAGRHGDHMCKLLTFLIALGAAILSLVPADAGYFLFVGKPPAIAVSVITTTGSVTWTVPANFISLVSVECISGGGGSDQNGSSGGGAYAKITSTSTTLTPGVTSISIGIGAGGAVTPTAGGHTWWNATSLANAVSNGSGQSVACQGGQPNSGATPGAGGAAASSVGTTTFSGGTGGVVSTTFGGGGGAAGPFGAGGSGGSGGSAGPGGGGGTNGGGGAGDTVTAGGNGGNGTEWTATLLNGSVSSASFGSGGAPGGSVGSGTAPTPGLYGAGVSGRRAGVGAPGILVITYRQS
jgi:hypothetical protein